MSERQVSIYWDSKLGTISNGQGNSTPEGRAIALAAVVKPGVGQFRSRLDWFWFSSYLGPELDDAAVPAAFMNQNGKCGFVKLRFACGEKTYSVFDQYLRNLVANIPHLWIGSVRAYSFADDFGISRYIGSQIDVMRKSVRADRIVRFLHAASELTLLGFETSGSNVTLDATQDSHNPQAYFMESIHHQLCNSADLKPMVALMRSPQVGSSKPTDRFIGHTYEPLFAANGWVNRGQGPAKH